MALTFKELVFKSKYIAPHQTHPEDMATNRNVNLGSFGIGLRLLSGYLPIISDAVLLYATDRTPQRHQVRQMDHLEDFQLLALFPD